MPTDETLPSVSQSADSWTAELAGGGEAFRLSGSWDDVQAGLLGKMSAGCPAAELAGWRQISGARPVSGWLAAASARWRLSLLRDGAVFGGMADG
jgi:hypothetical protein